jgi:ribosomal protein S18 acetylase RimI-like enzyme
MNYGVNKMMNNFEVLIGEVDNAIVIMREVAKWCIEADLNMWRLEELTREKLMENIKEENFCIGRIKDEYAASMILQWYDPYFWPNIKQNESGFVHKLCVRRKFAGMNLSKKMIEYAINECRKKGIGYLRLDTNGDNSKLCEIYEELGFIQVEKIKLRFRNYALYELRV